MKSLALSLSKISPEFLIDQNRFLPDLSYTFSQYLITCFLTAVRHEVNNLESSVVVQELEVLNLMKVLTLCQALTDRFPISCKQGNYRFLNIELAKTSWRLFSLCFTSSFLTCRYEGRPVESRLTNQGYIDMTKHYSLKSVLNIKIKHIFGIGILIIENSRLFRTRPR